MPYRVKVDVRFDPATIGLAKLVSRDETMPTIEIRRNSDGQVREYVDSYPWDGDYMWADGNYSCDCNRYLFFMRAAGEDEGELIDDRCGDDGYSVRITDEVDKVLYQDGEWSAV